MIRFPLCDHGNGVTKIITMSSKYSPVVFIKKKKKKNLGLSDFFLIPKIILISDLNFYLNLHFNFSQ